MTVRAAERAAQDGGARRRPRTRVVSADPALAERVRTAATQLTGLPARVAGGRLELHFGDETRLEELAETLERALQPEPRASRGHATIRDRGRLAQSVRAPL